MRYGKQEAVMTRGLAILSMVVLHLFCRQKPTVLGTPLLWLNDQVPFVAWFGFFAEFCVALYSICAGYAQYLLKSKGKNTYKDRLKRIIKLLVNYWIIVILFSIIGLLYNGGTLVPGTLKTFVLNLLLIKSYCGAWWYLHSYVFLLLLPSAVVMLFADHFKPLSGIIICIGIEFLWYLYSKFIGFPICSGTLVFLNYIMTEIGNLIGIMPSIWIGTILCREQAIEKIDCYLDQRISIKKRNWLIWFSWIVLFIALNIIHKAVLTGIEGLWMFLSFNLLYKGDKAKAFFSYMGKHSTNIWLVHMFFYISLFVGLVEIVRYPLFMLIFLLFLCLITSYIVIGIQSVGKYTWRLIENASKNYYMS